MDIDLAKPWHELPWSVLDFETDGPNPQECMPVSVACSRFWRGVECDSFYSLLNPGRPIAAEATAIHGISDDDVANAPTLPQIVNELARVADGALPVAYNSSFDRTILHRFADGARPLFDRSLEWVCPLVIIRGVDRFVSGKGRHKLETTCARWNVPMDSAHNALSDARAAARLLWKMRDRLGDISAERLIAAVCKRRVEQERDFENYRKKMGLPRE